jgi:long-chain fatty acid transport protein
MNQRRIAISLVSACCYTPLAMWANGMGLLSQDGFATARGEAFVATADNPSAIYYNPAGITQVEGSSLRSGIYGIYLDPSYTRPAGGHTYNISKHFSVAPQTFFVHTPENLRWSFGAGLYAPYGAAVAWPQDTGFRAVATSGRLTYVRFNPVAGFKLTPHLSIAAGVMVDYGNIKTEQGLRRNPSVLSDHFRFEGDGWAVGYNLGLLWQPTDQLSFGATFRSSTPLNFQGTTDYLQQPINYQPPRLPASMEMDFPMTIAGGISYRPSKNWNVEFDATWTDWSSFGTLSIQQQGSPPIGPQNLPVSMDWKASWLFAVGATRYLENGWHVSTGYAFNQNSVPDDYYSPVVADLDRHFFTLGAGHNGRRFDFDIAYQFGYGPARTVTGSTPSSQPATLTGVNADGTYKFISHAVLVTLGLHF